MTSETLLPKKPELSLDEVDMQNLESYSYLRSLVSEDESPIKIDNETTLRFLKGGRPLRARLDKVEVIFHKDSQIRAELYLVYDGGLIEFGMNSGSLALSSGLQVEMHDYKDNDDGRDLLREEDKGVRTAAKVIADTVRVKVEARASAEA